MTNVLVKKKEKRTKNDECVSEKEKGERGMTNALVKKKKGEQGMTNILVKKDKGERGMTKTEGEKKYEIQVVSIA